MKLKSEAEKEKSKLDPWKLKHFEPIWGEGQYQSGSRIAANHQSLKPSTIKLDETDRDNVTTSTAATTTASINYTTSSGRTVKNPVSYNSTNYNNCPKRATRTVGAMTRSTTAAVIYHGDGSPTKVIFNFCFKQKKVLKFNI